MPVNGKKVVTWVEKELPPLSWGVISIKMMKSFMKAGISPRNVSDETMFSDELMADLKAAIQDTYKKEISV